MSRYLTIYTTQTDNPQAVFALTMKLAGTDALDLNDTHIGVYEILTEEKVAGRTNRSA